MRSIRYFVGVAALAAGFACTVPTFGKGGGVLGPEDPQKQAEAQKEAEKKFGLEAFTDPKQIGYFLLLLLGSSALGALLAYHPSTRRTSMEDLDQPKITITYAVVGTLVGIVVPPIPAMGIAIFGIGGLMRFRTELSAAKETGRVILATMIGITCGLNLWMVAIITTAFSWILIYVLESRTNERLTVRGVRSETIGPSSEAYAKALHGLNCRFHAPRKNPKKGQITYTMQVPQNVSREAIEAKCNEEVPKDLRGTIDWPED
jgi:hypothetical protein